MRLEETSVKTNLYETFHQKVFNPLSVYNYVIYLGFIPFH